MLRTLYTDLLELGKFLEEKLSVFGDTRCYLRYNHIRVTFPSSIPAPLLKEILAPGILQIIGKDTPSRFKNVMTDSFGLIADTPHLSLYHPVTSVEINETNCPCSLEHFIFHYYTILTNYKYLPGDEWPPGNESSGGVIESISRTGQPEITPEQYSKWRK